MENHIIGGLEINKISMKALFFNKVMFLSYALLLVGLFGLYEVFHERYFLLTANAFDAGLSPGNRDVAEAMKEAVFGSGGEVKRESPWSLYIVNYMYMIYTGSGIVFLIALGKLLDIEILKKTAAGFMTLGLAMILAGLFTIFVDLNILHMHWMFLAPHIKAGMWLMLPLYMVYIPIILLEIYLLITHHHVWAKRVALIVLILSILVEFVEYFVQAKLFDMNTARHLWTTYPFLTLYLMVSSFVASAGVMILYSFVVYRDRLKEEFSVLLNSLKQMALYSVIVLGAYEAVAYLFIDKKWAAIILFGDFKFYFYAYIFLAVGIPFVLFFKNQTGNFIKVLAAFSIVIGTYLGRLIFVYGGNAYPMNDRFGVGFEKYGEYEPVREVILFAPSVGEISIVIGSFGVVLIVYKVIDSLLSVSLIREH